MERPARAGLPAWTPERVYQMFPRLAERKTNLGTQLSGGEQQMLAVGRALVLNPRLLLLDEPLEGLAPIIVEELLKAIRRITREEGLSAIIVEQHPQAILAVSDPQVGSVSCPAASLLPGATVTCAGRSPHTIDQADVDAGEFTNTAISSGLDPTGATVRRVVRAGRPS